MPLYVKQDATGQLALHGKSRRAPNLNEKIVERISKQLGIPFIHEHDGKTAEGRTTFSPLDLLDYVYAVLHCPTYRETYKEFLKIDFPRIPYPESAKGFWRLAALGKEIRSLHMMESPRLNKPTSRYPVGGDNKVGKIEYNGARVFINAEQYFEKVPQTAWDFCIGAYQPAQKWLKDRKGQRLNFDDITHYQKILAALIETDRLMKEIDAAWKP